MENHLLTVVKTRVMDIFEESLQRHPVYADTQVYHKFHALKERQQYGVILRGASATRTKMSADDFLGDLSSHCTLARVGSAPGTSVEWAWEDQAHVTVTVRDEAASLDARRTTIQTSRHPITAGPGNTVAATNFAQVTVKVDGLEVMPASVDGVSGKITLSAPVPALSSCTVTYCADNLDIPGYYFLEVFDYDAHARQGSFGVTPLHRVKDEVLVAKTTGLESTATLAHHPVVLTSPYYLYTKKQANSNRFMLEYGTEYTLDATGLVTFLLPLPSGTTVYASYGWQGVNRGPFAITAENTYNADAIRGVVLAFGTRVQAGDKQVVLLAPQKEAMARVFGGHYTMQFDLQVYAKDPTALSEMVDHLVSDIWGNMRQPLMFEGLTIDELDPTGESEENYDDSAQIMYFQHSISLTMITEWKKFTPYLVNIREFNVNLFRFPELVSHPVDEETWWNKYTVTPDPRDFEVVYPKADYPRYY